MSELLEKIETSINQTFDCGVVLEVLNSNLTKKTLTVLVNSKDKWDEGNMINSLEFINAEISTVAKNDNEAIGYKSTGFKMVKNDEGIVICEPFLFWNPQHITRKTNQG